jgi:DNA-binding Xre family transcriptional regulator
MKLKIRIREVAISRGIKTAYQLQKRAGLQPSTAARLYKNDVTQITLDTLGKLCEALDCHAGDLFVRPSAKSSNVKAKA